MKYEPEGSMRKYTNEGQYTNEEILAVRRSGDAMKYEPMKYEPLGGTKEPAAICYHPVDPDDVSLFVKCTFSILLNMPAPPVKKPRKPRK